MKQNLLFLLILTSLVFLLYSNTFHAPFVFDDIKNITENPHIMMTEISLPQIVQIKDSPSPRPFANFTFALNYFFHRYNVFGYHLINLLIHIATAFILFLIARDTMRLCRFDTFIFPYCVAIFWMVNPVHTQSVTYIVQRMASMATLFYLLSLLCYIRARIVIKTSEHANKIHFGSLLTLGFLSAMLAVLSKQIAATLPIVIFLYEFYFFRNLDFGWVKKHYGWLCLAVSLCIIIAATCIGKSPFETIMADYGNQNFTMGQRLLTEPRVIIYYLSLLFFPYPLRLNLAHDFSHSTSLISPATTTLSMLALTVLFIGAIFMAHKHRILSFAILWLFINLVIESSIIGKALLFEHRTYLPSTFFFLGIGWYLISHLKSTPFIISAIFLYICTCGFWTFQRNHVWQEKITLWQDCVNKAPLQVYAHNYLALAFKNNNNFNEAIAHYNKALNLGMMRLKKGHPEIALTYNNLGAVYKNTGDYEQAIQCYQKALDIILAKYGPFNTRIATIYNNMAGVLHHKGDIEKAIQYYQKALSISIQTLGTGHKNVAAIYNNLASAYQADGNNKKATECLQTASRIIQEKYGTKHPYTKIIFDNYDAVSQNSANRVLKNKKESKLLD